MARLEETVASTAALSQPRKFAFAYLLEAHETAQELDRPALQFACQLPALLTHGITEASLRWLLERGLAEHHVEITGSERCSRTFRRSPNNRFQPNSCLLLTAAGIALARDHWLDLARQIPNSSGALRPHFDTSRRILVLGDQIVKQFKVPAANQELILTAFEEEAWPPHLSDPLPPAPAIAPKKRLHDTIDRLNRSQEVPMIRFHGDGTGQGVCWAHARRR
jgi:hypothetical protein